jgi:hypothetical protein
MSGYFASTARSIESPGHDLRRIGLTVFSMQYPVSAIGLSFANLAAATAAHSRVRRTIKPLGRTLPLLILYLLDQLPVQA